MQDIQINFSLKGKTYIGRWYRNNTISIFLNRIWSFTNERYKPKDVEQIFYAMIFSTEFHEIGHLKIKDWKIRGQPCKHGTSCRNGNCLWCEYMGVIAGWFMETRGIVI